MKKQYAAPTLSNYGAVEELTQALGQGVKTDFFILNGTQIADDYGSRDLEVTVTVK
jgi:hypothetical protein